MSCRSQLPTRPLPLPRILPPMLPPPLVIDYLPFCQPSLRAEEEQALIARLGSPGSGTELILSPPALVEVNDLSSACALSLSKLDR
jgi:hypothetical protein